MSTSNLAPCPRPHEAIQTRRPFETPVLENSEFSQALDDDAADDCDSGATPRDGESEVPIDGSSAPTCVSPVPMLQCSTRQQLPLDRYGDWTV